MQSSKQLTNENLSNLLGEIKYELTNEGKVIMKITLLQTNELFTK